MDKLVIKIEDKKTLAKLKELRVHNINISDVIQKLLLDYKV